VTTIKRFAACKLALYGPDHPPPHFHVVGPDFSALVEIATLRVMEGDVRRAADAMAWAPRTGTCS